MDAGDVNQAVLPCEDSANGAVSEVYDCLAKFNNIQIEREFAYEIDHCLVALPGVKLVDVKSVYCYPQVGCRDTDFKCKSTPVFAPGCGLTNICSIAIFVSRQKPSMIITKGNAMQ